MINIFNCIYIILSIALSIPTLITLRGCALKHHIRLTKGMAFSLLIGVEHALLLLLGIWVGNMLRFGLPEYDNLIYLGLMVVVALRMFFPAFRKKEKELPSYDISRLGTVLLLGVATGTNILFVGLGLGFRVLFANDLWRGGIPMLVVVFLWLTSPISSHLIARLAVTAEKDPGEKMEVKD